MSESMKELIEGRKSDFEESDVDSLNNLVEVMDKISRSIGDLFGFRRLPYLVGNQNFKKLKQIDKEFDEVLREVVDDYVEARDKFKK